MVARGEIWWVDFGEPYGSEPGYRRPAVVVSSDRFNASRIQTIVVSILTSNLRLVASPGNVELVEGTAGIPRDWVVNVSQTAVVDRVRFADFIGTLDSATMQQVSAGLRLLLAL